MLLRALFAGNDTPLRASTVDILPHQFRDFGLRAELRVDARVRSHVAHHPVIGLFRNAALKRTWAEICDPLCECRRLHRNGGALDGEASGKGDCAHQEGATAADFGSNGKKDSRHDRIVVTGRARTIGRMSLAVVALTPFSGVFALFVRLLFYLLRLVSCAN